MGLFFGPKNGVNDVVLLATFLCAGLGVAVFWFSFWGRDWCKYRFHVAFAQVQKFWAWLDYLKHQATAAGKEVLFINLGDTSVPSSFGGMVGNLVGRRLWPRAGKRPVLKLTRALLRGAVTHVACVTHRADIQAKLPQVFLGSPKLFTRALLASHAANDKPPNIHLQRRSGWNTVQSMLLIIEMLADVLAGYSSPAPVLLLDCAGCHLNPAVPSAAAAAAAAAARGVWVAYIAARLTWILQPLDVFVFAGYMLYLRRKYQAALTEGGAVSAEAWLRMLSQVCQRHFCGHRWLRAIDCVGAVGNKQALAKDLLASQIPAAPAAPPALPAVSDLRSILARGRKRVPCWQLFTAPSKRQRLTLRLRFR